MSNDWITAWRMGRPRMAAEIAQRTFAGARTSSERVRAFPGLVATGETWLAHSALEELGTADLGAEELVALAVHAHPLGEHAAGLRLCARARSMGAAGPRLDYLHATLQMFSGELDGAESLLENCLRAAPQTAGAHWTLAQLRKWTTGENHLERLRRVLASRQDADEDFPYLGFALFKELDDLEHPEAWSALVHACLSKRRRLEYDSVAETAVFDALSSRSGGSSREAVPAKTDPVPIFIVGMPRSGTTLLERLLAAHSQVAGCGELQDFPKQLQWCCDHAGQEIPDIELVRRLPDVDPSLLGQRYMMQAQWRAGDKPYFTDKLPRNFWHLGSIARALPQARILHMVRNPMDTCFSNLKELFGSAYKYSYNLAELARHFAGYRRLMDHWRHVVPDRILDVHYEALVSEPEVVMQQVLAHCGLEWEPACLSSDRLADTVATASVVQVRSPIHQRSVGGWRRYAAQLDPLHEQLKALGVADAG